MWLQRAARIVPDQATRGVSTSAATTAAIHGDSMKWRATECAPRAARAMPPSQSVAQPAMDPLTMKSASC